MSIDSNTPSYNEVTSALKKNPAKFNAAQIHGLFCGLICGTASKKRDHWEKLLPELNDQPKTQELLQQLHESSFHQLSEFSFEFSLLLPSDTHELRERTEALGLWCQGFITGLTKAHVRIENREDSDVTEAINDIIEIAQVNFGDTPDDENDETAYFELVEYVRLAVLMIFHEIKSEHPNKNTGNSDFLH